MNFNSIQSALKGARKFRKAYGSKHDRYKCRRWCQAYVVEVWQLGMNGYYFSTLV